MPTSNKGVIGLDAQTAINIAFALAGALGGWVLKFMHDELKQLQHGDRELVAKVHAIETLVAGQYVTRDVLDKSLVALFAKLDRIEFKLDGKVDK
jgi:hypothetical protein